MRADLPSGTVTFVFTDIEGSTRLLDEVGPEAYAQALAGHRRIVREACAAFEGAEVDTQGDASSLPPPCRRWACGRPSNHRATGRGPDRATIGVHTGSPLLTDEGYVGADVHRAARIAAAGHGGEVLDQRIDGRVGHVVLRDLGEHRFRDLAAPERQFFSSARAISRRSSLSTDRTCRWPPRRSSDADRAGGGRSLAWRRPGLASCR